MPRTLPSKEDFAKRLLQIDVPYRDVQIILRNKYGSGLSNNTMQELKDQVIDLESLNKELQELRKLKPLVEEVDTLRTELETYKRMYFELMETLRETLQK